MNKSGFLLIHTLLGLFLLGLVTVTCLPILDTALNNFGLVNIKMDMIYIAESIIEQIKSFDYDNMVEEEFIFDLQLVKLIEILEEKSQVDICLPLNLDEEEYKYFCKIHKSEVDNLWEIEVNISPIKEVRGIKDVNLKAILPIPKKGLIDNE